MNARASVFRSHLDTGSLRRAGCFLALAVLTAGTLVSLRAAEVETQPLAAEDEAPGAGPAGAWGSAAHRLILDEAVDRLPEPLRGLFATPTRRNRLREAVAAPPADPFFRIDALTDEPHPFKDFPRSRAEAEAAFGAEAVEAAGTAPWSAAETLDRLGDALADGRTDDVFASAGALARSAIGLHMPFHTTVNSDGGRTGNHGVARAVGVGLLRRYGDFYAAEIRKGRRPVRYLSKPKDHLAGWAIAAHGRIGPVLEADAVARKKATYNPAQHPEDLADLDAVAARPYYEALKRDLERRGSPEAAALRDAAAHLPDLIYTAWVRAGKPPSLRAAAAEGGKPDAAPPYWLLVLAAVSLAILLWPRRRQGAGGGEQDGGPGDS